MAGLLPSLALPFALLVQESADFRGDYLLIWKIFCFVEFVKGASCFDWFSGRSSPDSQNEYFSIFFAAIIFSSSLVSSCVPTLPFSCAASFSIS